MSSLTSVSRKIHKCKAWQSLLWCLILFGVCIVYFFSIRENAPTLQSHDQTISENAPTSQSSSRPISENHVLCVLVPYRERFEELIEFVPHMSKLLKRQSISYHIIIIDHLSDGYRFNRGAAFNAGFLIMRKKFPECDYIALHDIDLLPLAKEISYGYPGNDVYHAIPPGFHPVPLYSHRDYIGGIFLISSEVFSRLNGFANFYWGWGFEDIDFRRRMSLQSVQITRPEILSTNRSNSFKHLHGSSRPRDSTWCQNQVLAFHTRVGQTGLSDVNFTLASETYLSIEGFPCYVFNINIQCIFKDTPWCRPNCMEELPIKTKTFWDLDGEVVWDRILAFGSLVNPLTENLLGIRTKLTNVGMPENSLPWDRLLDQAQYSNKEN